MPTPPTAAARGRLPLVLLTVVAWVLAGCSTGSSSDREPPATRSPNAAPTSASRTDPSASAAPSSAPHVVGRPHILFLGNSHTKRHDVAGTVAAMLRASRPRVDATVAVAPGLLHLDERATHGPTLRLLGSRHWDVVVLQAQNYSLSGNNDYPDDGSVTLVQAVTERGGLPVLFAEWPRRGIDETQIILDTYEAIADQAPACLPPIPETFDHALAQDPRLRLRAADGNHSSAAGAFLASLVLYAAISGKDVTALPDIRGPHVAPVLQRHLRALAAQELALIPAARGCPAPG